MHAAGVARLRQKEQLAAWGEHWLTEGLLNMFCQLIQWLVNCLNGCLIVDVSMRWCLHWKWLAWFLHCTIMYTHIGRSHIGKKVDLHGLQDRRLNISVKLDALLSDASAVFSHQSLDCAFCQAFHFQPDPQGNPIFHSQKRIHRHSGLRPPMLLIVHCAY